MVEVRVPRSGESITEVQIGEWRKVEGDAVQSDEILVELETDKASLELPAPAAGRLVRILKKNGEIAQINEVIAEIEPGAGGETAAASGAAAEAQPKAPGPRPQESPPQPAEAQPPTPAATPVRTPPRVPVPAPSQVTATPARDRGRAGGKPETPPPPPQKIEPPPQPPAEEPAAAPPEIEIRPRIMPAARRALAEHGLTPADIPGSGPGGRILKEDVERYVAKLRGERETPAASGVMLTPTAAPPPSAGDRQDTIVPMTMLRRRVAERLVEAQKNAALLTTFNEIDMSAVMSLRERYQPAFQDRHGVKLGFMSFFVRAAVDALRRIPQLNGEIREQNIVYHNYYDIGVAVSTDKGLVVPVLRDADRMTFADIESTITDLALRAREGKLKIEELEGGTFTITNGGIFGSLLSTPIVNPPQSGILGLHVIQDRPVARDGNVVIRPMMYVALSYDHRIVDGREAVTFLRHIKEVIEEPARLLIEA